MQLDMFGDQRAQLIVRRQANPNADGRVGGDARARLPAHVIFAGRQENGIAAPFAIHAYDFSRLHTARTVDVQFRTAINRSFA